MQPSRNTRVGFACESTHGRLIRNVIRLGCMPTGPSISWTKLQPTGSSLNQEQSHACFFYARPDGTDHHRCHARGCRRRCGCLGRRPDAQPLSVRYQSQPETVPGLWATRVTPRYDLPAVWVPSSDAAITVSRPWSRYDTKRHLTSKDLTLRGTSRRSNSVDSSAPPRS